MTRKITPQVATPFQPVQKPALPPVKTTHPLPSLKSDRVLFGKIPDATFILPPKSLVVTVPGMLSPESSIKSLNEYLKKKGHKAHIIQIPSVAKGGNVWESTDWLMSQIDQIRIEEASNRFVELIKKLKEAPPNQKLQVIHNIFNLQNTALGNATAQVMLNIILTPESGHTRETDFTREVLKLRELRIKKHRGILTDRQRLKRLTANVRTELTKELRDNFYAQPGSAVINEQRLQKTLNHVIDQLAPRVVVVGHSLGGFVGTQSLFEQGGDISMVVSLGSPVGGTDNIPPAFRFLEYTFPTKRLQNLTRRILEGIFPALSHMKKDSPEVIRIQTPYQPDDTSAVSISSPLDGLVRPENARLNEDHPGRLNIVVKPQRSEMFNMIPEVYQGLVQLVSLNPAIPFFRKQILQRTKLWEGLAQHCGLIQFEDTYWPQDGEMLHQVLDGPDACKWICKLLDPKNYESVRSRVLDLLIDRLQDAKVEDPDKYTSLRQQYSPLKTNLTALGKEEIPVFNNVSEKAHTLLGLL